MQIYLVGGAVRDGLLKLPITDKDYVVVGATPQQMLDLGFLQVGADFPVFLHPHSKQEYALARTERKSGKGYKGFEVYAAPDVTLEEDLIRRDLTINAMAIEVKGIEDDTPINGNVIDPYGGQEDINNRILRHVSNAFSEDPLRILRLARFYSRFYGYHCDGLIDAPFSIAQSTKTLIGDIITAGELAHLTAERVWQETQRALMQRAPQAYIQCLSDLHALPHLMPNVAKLWQQPHTRQLINRALNLSATANLTLAQRWAIIMSAFIDDDEPSVEIMQTLKDIGSSVKAPKAITQFALQFATVSSQLQRLTLLDAKELANLITQTRAYKDKAQDLNALLVVQHTLQMAQQQLAVQDYIAAYNQVGMQDIDSSLQGAAIGDALMQARTKAIEDILQESRI